MKKNILFSLVIAGLALAGCDSTSDSSTKDQPTAAKTTVADTTMTNDVVATVAYPDEMPKGRLPESVRPTNYHIDLTIDPDKALFNGHVEINLDLDTAISHLWLNGKDLQVKAARIELTDGTSLDATYEQVEDSGIAKLSIAGTVPQGNATLHMHYDAPFNEALEGLYRVKDGELNYAFTQFEATSARLAFPGFDEPNFKVTFDVTMTVRNEHLAFGNTPVSSEEDLGNGMKKITFARTKPLPTYLMAFAVGDFDVVEWEAIPANSIRKVAIPLRGIATKGKGAKLDYALENTNDILTSLEAYFEIPYPYEKLDIVAVPDFNAGAMENAGLITYREQLLLFDDTISLGQKRAYYNVHAHELAHQWFGNLVTPVWWDDIWLNEAFATWMAHVSNNMVYPEQKFRQALLGRSLGAMGQDSLINARQIRQPIASNHDIQSAFDGITYSKGGGVLSMIESFMTPEQFRAGIQNYMHRFAFKNATAEDFITAIAEKAENVSVEELRSAFFSFLEQPGIPYLAMDMKCEDNQASITVDQSRYLPIGSKGSSEQSWKVPACMKYAIDGSELQHCEVIEQTTQVITLPESGCPDYIMPNAEGAGYFRYSMSGDNWKKLMAHKDMLSTEDMMSVNDSFSAAINAGDLQFSDMIAIAPNLINSDSPRIATAPIGTLSYAYTRIAKTDADKSKLAKVNRDLYGDKLAQLGLTTREGDSVEQIQMRNSLIGFLASQGESPEIRQYLTDMATAYTGYKTDNAIHADKADSNLIGSAIGVAVEDLGVPFAEHLLALLKQSNDGTVRGRLLGGLSSVQDEEYAIGLRDLILSQELRDNEMSRILYGQLSEPELQAGMWTWFKANFDGVKARIPPFGQYRLPSIGGVFCSAEEKADFIEFFTPLVEEIAGAPRPFRQAIESIELCEARVKHHTPNITDYINSL